MTYPWCDHIDHDAFGELDLSGSGGKSGAIGCMLRRLDDLNKAEQRLLAEVRFIRAAQAAASSALDRFISTPAQAGE